MKEAGCVGAAVRTIVVSHLHAFSPKPENIELAALRTQAKMYRIKYTILNLKNLIIDC